MIIISQDERIIHNFNNVNCIIIRKVEERYCIILFDNTYDMKGDGDYIGIYKTEERAKEVLNEISIAYANMELIKIPKIEIQQKITSTELLKNICYKMPEE